MPSRVRYKVLAMTVMLASITYLDRVCISITASAAMNTSGQAGGFLSLIVVAFVVQHFSNWTAPLYLPGGLYLFGAVCWIGIDPRDRLSPEPAAAS